VLHPFIEACLDLRKKLNSTEIKKIHLHVTRYEKAWLEPIEERRRPHNAATAANSIFFGVAKTLVNGNVTLADFTPRGLEQAEVLALAAVTDYVLDENPGIEVTLRSGQVLKASVGGKRRPLGYGELAAKFRDCAQYAARPVAVEEVIERIANLENEADVGLLPALLGGSKMAS
jgi:2-methylcitrate dehydratase PrpD